MNIDKSKTMIISYNENKIFTNVTKKELLHILKNETAVVLLINSKKTTNKIIDLLYKDKSDNINIYVYNIKNDEPLLDLFKSEIIIKKYPSELYKELLNILGSHAEDYIIEQDGKTIKTDYKKIYTPYFIFIKNGQIELTHYIKTDDIKNEEILPIYKKGYELLNNEYNS